MVLSTYFEIEKIEKGFTFILPVESVQHGASAETLNPEIYLNILAEAWPFLKFKLKKKVFMMQNNLIAVNIKCKIVIWAIIPHS